MRLPRERRRPALFVACGIAGAAVLVFGAPVWAAVLGVMVAAYAIGIRPGGAGDDVDTSDTASSDLSTGDSSTGGLSSAGDSGDAGGDSDGGSE